jgi:asparagine synthase (glutamine-hydrolysing)
MTQTLIGSDRLRWLRIGLPYESVPFPATSWGRLCKRAHMVRGEEIAALRVEGFPKNILDPIGLNEAQQCRLRRRQQELGDRMWTPGSQRLSEVQEFDVAWQLPESLLQKADKMSMAASIELRCPFLDLGVAAVAASIPAHLRLDMAKGVGKLALRRCVERITPGFGAARKKGFYLPLGRWLRNDLRRVVEDDLFRAESRVAQLLDRPMLRAAWQRFLQGEALAEVFYALWIYERWVRLLSHHRVCVGNSSRDCRPVVLQSS